MKNTSIKFISLIVIICLVIATPYSNYAAKRINTDITSKSFLKSLNPFKKPTDSVGAISDPIGNSFVVIVNGILGIIQVLGILLTVVSIAIYGFRVLLSADPSLAQDMGFSFFRNEKPKTSRQWMNFGRGLLIGSVLLFSSSTFVKFMFNIFKQ